MFSIFFLASFCLSDHVSDIWFFTYWLYCDQEIFSCLFLLLCFSSIVTIIFTMFIFCAIKIHPLAWPSHLRTINLTQHRNRSLQWSVTWIFSRKKQPKPEEIVDILRLKLQFGIFLESLNLLIWHFPKMKNRECWINITRN